MLCDAYYYYANNFKEKLNGFSQVVMSYEFWHDEARQTGRFGGVMFGVLVLKHDRNQTEHDGDQRLIVNLG